MNRSGRWPCLFIAALFLIVWLHHPQGAGLENIIGILLADTLKLMLYTTLSVIAIRRISGTQATNEILATYALASFSVWLLMTVALRLV